MNHEVVRGIATILAASVAATLGWTWYYLNHCVTHPDLEGDAEHDDDEPVKMRITRRERLKGLLHVRLREDRVPEERAMTIFIGNQRNWKNAIAKPHSDAVFLNIKQLKEKILGPAIRHPDGLIYAIGRRGRHHHCIRYMSKLGRANLYTTRDQGFITTHGRYVDRIVALRIAKAADQLIRKTPPAHLLFSEDLW
jgi:hypothetical protein